MLSKSKTHVSVSVFVLFLLVHGLFTKELVGGLVSTVKATKSSRTSNTSSTSTTIAPSPSSSAPGQWSPSKWGVVGILSSNFNTVKATKSTRTSNTRSTSTTIAPPSAPGQWSPSKWGVVGILSSNFNAPLRQAQRQTWVKDSKDSYPLHVYFLLDQETPELLEEQNTHGDLVFLNASYSGRAVRFGEKLFLWHQLALENHPQAKFVIKADDDVIVCPNQIWPWIFDNVEPKSYIGYMHRPRKRDQLVRMDEMFVALGSDLWQRITNRKYCHDEKHCDLTIDLVDTNFGGTSLGKWLSMYPDVHFQPINDLLPGGKVRQELFNQSIVGNFTCPKYLWHPVKKANTFPHIYKTMCQNECQTK